VAVRLTESPPEHLIGRKLCDVHFAAYGSEALVDEVGLDAGLGGLPWIGFDERLDSRWLTQWLAEHAPGAHIAVRIDEGAILRRQAVVAGMGAFFMPCFEADAIGGLRRLTPGTITRPLWLLTLADLRHTSRVRAFMDHMAEVPDLLGRCSS
jgi:DNA-binding transcriptional LysR family regulator